MRRLLALIGMTAALFLAACGSQAPETLKERHQIMCEEEYFQFEESLQHQSVQFMEEPYKAAEEYCRK